MSCYAMMNILAVDDLTPGQKSVWQYLVFRANGAKVCWPKVADIASYLGMSDRNVMAATKKLVDTGRIKVTKRYKDTNNYHIIDLPGLHDKPDFRDQRQPASSSDAPIPDVKKTTVERRSEVKKTTQLDLLPCKNTHSEVKKPALPSIQQESNKEERALLRNGDSALPLAVAPNDIRKLVWEEGKAIVRQLTGKLDTPARKQIGVFLREAKDDCSVVLEVLRNASREGPFEPVPWIVAGIHARTAPQRSKFDQIHFEMGTKSLLTREYDEAGNVVFVP